MSTKANILYLINIKAQHMFAELSIIGGVPKETPHLPGMLHSHQKLL